MIKRLLYLGLVLTAGAAWATEGRASLEVSAQQDRLAPVSVSSAPSGNRFERAPLLANDVLMSRASDSGKGAVRVALNIPCQQACGMAAGQCHRNCTNSCPGAAACHTACTQQYEQCLLTCN